MDPSQKKKLCNRYSLIKRTVRLVLLHSDSYPSAPTKNIVLVIAKAAEERIRESLGFDTGVNITMSKLEKQPSLKELEQSLMLPDDTPEQMPKYFNTTS